MNPWDAKLTPHERRRLGKTLEELGELTAVIARIGIQGIDAVDPSSGKTNRQRFIEETADVIAQIRCNVAPFDLPTDVIDQRVRLKESQMDQWEAHFERTAK